MPTSRNVLFLVDHKHRDLPALCLIAHHLTRQGVRPQLVALGMEEQVVREFDPGFIVIPKPNYNFQRLITYKSEGRKIVVIESEGNHQDIKLTMRVIVAPDVYYFWNEDVHSKYKDALRRRGAKTEVLGFYRGDLLHSNYSNVFPRREELLSKYGLSPERFTVTIATSTQDSHFSDDRLKKKERRRNRSFSETADYSLIVQNMRDLRSVTESVIKEISQNFEDVNIIVKPHPNESVVYWDAFIGSLGKNNVALMVGEPINHLLRMSDLHIAHNVCTTTVEALLANVTTVEIQTSRSRELYAPQHLGMPDLIVSEGFEINKILKLILQGEDVRSNGNTGRSDRVQRYIRQYLHDFDGRRCETYAERIHAEIERAELQASGALSQVLLNLRYMPLFAALKLRHWILAPIKQKDAAVIAEVNNPSSDNLRPVYVINGKPIDAEYGLYDNRMQPGDSQAWLSAFAECDKPI